MDHRLITLHSNVTNTLNRELFVRNSISLLAAVFLFHQSCSIFGTFSIRYSARPPTILHRLISLMIVTKACWKINEMKYCNILHELLYHFPMHAKIPAAWPTFLKHPPPPIGRSLLNHINYWNYGVILVRMIIIQVDYISCSILLNCKFYYIIILIIRRRRLLKFQRITRWKKSIKSTHALNV